MNKYIIKNCPAMSLFDFYCDEYEKPCQDCTDCIMKQIANYCLDQNLKYDTTACDILDILDIQEVE